MQVLQAGPEKGAGLVERLHAALDKQVCQNPVYPEFRREPADLFRVGRRFHGPFALNGAHRP